MILPTKKFAFPINSHLRGLDFGMEWVHCARIKGTLAPPKVVPRFRTQGRRSFHSSFGPSYRTHRANCPGVKIRKVPTQAKEAWVEHPAEKSLFGDNAYG